MGFDVTCRDFVQFLDDYLEGRLGAEQVRGFNDHLAACPSCVNYLNSYRDTLRLGKAALAASSEPVPDTIPEDLVRAILKARKPA
jgi:anti-sigma factor RsiW